VALYPPVTALFLLALERASRRESWRLFEIASLSVTLALLTYTYSVGRLLAPLLALGLALFATRRRWPGVCLTWLAYLLTLVPLLAFSRAHPGALTARFRDLTYLAPRSSAVEAARKFFGHYFANLSLWKLLVAGGQDLRDHVPAMGELLVATFALAVAGVALVLLRRRGDAFWRFVLYGLAASVVPASLTDNDFPILRLSSFPVFLVVVRPPREPRRVRLRARPGAGRRRVVSR
jgi:hypothetical protein